MPGSLTAQYGLNVILRKKNPVHFYSIYSQISAYINSFVGFLSMKPLFLIKYLLTNLSGIMFSIHNVLRSHRVVWSIVKVKLNSGVNIVQTSSTNIVDSCRE